MLDMHLMPLGNTTSSSFSTFLQNAMVDYGSILLMGKEMIFKDLVCVL